MRVFKKALLIILILCITCTSTPIYAFGELINQEKEISENRKLEVTEEKSSQDGNVSPFVEENKTPEIGEENLPVTDENKIPETSETEKNNATDTEKNKTITEDENEKSGKEVAEEKEIVTEESLESVLERRKSILEGDILSKKNKSVSNETKKAASTLFRSISMSIQDFLDNITKNTKFNKEDNKLHFIIKHWHHNQMTKNEGSEEKEETNDSEKLVTIEGYIEKKENESGYKIEIRKDTGSYTSITNENKGDCSDYVENVDTTNGTITFKANPLQQDGKPLEHFTAFAVGAGRKAVDENEEQEKVTN